MKKIINNSLFFVSIISCLIFTYCEINATHGSNEQLAWMCALIFSCLSLALITERDKYVNHEKNN